MITKRLLAHTTPEATEYIQKVVNSKNQADYQKLKKLFDEHKFVTNNFDDTELNIATFDWQNLDRDRNWWWQLQALPFLNWYANSLALQNEEERSRYFSLCLDAIQNWINQAKQNKESPLAWHDHAAAFRVRNLTNWLVFSHSTGLSLIEEPCVEVLGSLVIEHLDWLQEDKHYSKHTNHGFDQAMIALTIGLMFDHDEFIAYRQRNRERLKDEVTFAFTEEGVHKENSPGYQKMMLGRLKQLRTLAPLGEQEISQMGERYIEKAEAFLRAITLPNGFLPMVGDTQGGEAGISYALEEKECTLVFNYSESGYVVIKGRSKKVGRFYFLMKNCHHSNYHRHDDDLMIYLWVNGEIVFGDGGLYSHNEKDRIRRFLRAHLAHSTVFLKSKPVRDKAKITSPPNMSIDGNTIVAESFMFGSKIVRKIDFSSIGDGCLKLKDEAEYGPIFLNFCFGDNASVGLIKKNCFFVKFSSAFCEVVSTAKFHSLFKGENDSFSELSYVSKKYNVVSDALRIMLSSSSSSVENTIKFGCLE